MAPTRPIYRLETLRQEAKVGREMVGLLGADVPRLSQPSQPPPQPAALCPLDPKGLAGKKEAEPEVQ